MAPRFRLGITREPPRSGGSPVGPPIESFLDLLSRLLGLPAAQSRAIREELDGHLRERVRDLMIAGASEPAAVRAAIEELGDAAALASRFRAAARTPFRRSAMNLAILGVAGAALVTSIVAVKDGPAPRAQSAVYAAPSAQPGARGAPGPTFDLRAKGAPIRELIGSVAAGVGARPAVRWGSLGELGIVPDSGFTVEAPATDVRGAFEAINESLAAEGFGPVEYRLREGVLEVAARDYFDRRESTLVRYDIMAILEAGVSEDEFRGLVQQFVEPDSWADNGGDKARMSIVAGKAFVQAPPRIHDGVVWFIEQLGGDNGAGAAMKPPAPGDARLGELPLIAHLLRSGIAPNADAGINIFALSHTTPGDVIHILRTRHDDLGLEYQADPVNNSIIVRGPAEGRGRLTQILTTLDRPAGPATTQTPR